MNIIYKKLNYEFYNNDFQFNVFPYLSIRLYKINNIYKINNEIKNFDFCFLFLTIKIYYHITFK